MDFPPPQRRSAKRGNSVGGSPAGGSNLSRWRGVMRGANLGARPLTALRRVLRCARSYAPSGCAMGGCVLEADYGVRLGTFLTLDDVEFDVIALFQRFVSVQLDR